MGNSLFHVKKTLQKSPAAVFCNSLPGLIALYALQVCLIICFSSNIPAQTKDNGERKSKTGEKKGSPAKPASSKTSNKTTQKKAAPPKLDKAKTQEKKALPEKNAKAAEKKPQKPPAEEILTPLDESLRYETAMNISQDIFENEDLEIRKLAINALGKRAGTIVVIDPQSGRVLSIVNQNWAIKRSFKPCSTIKLVTAVAGLNERIISNEGMIRNSWLQIDLTDATAFSNNTYFQTVGANLGYRKMTVYARALGLGEPTGINYEGEVGGNVPDFKFGSEIFRIYSHGDDFEVTALQLGVLVAAITNGGKIILPRIPNLRLQEASDIKSYRKQLNIAPEVLQDIIPGMLGSVNYGTSQPAFDPMMNIAGKTGSCIEDGTWLGLFASVSSVIDPKYAVIVITRGSNERGKNAAEIAGKIYRGIKGRLAPEPQMIASPKYNIEKSIEIDNAQTADSDDTAFFSGVSASRKRKINNNVVTEMEKQREIKADSKGTIVMPVPANPNAVRPRIVKP